MEVGETWAYRARSVDLLTEVEVRRIGTKRPPRVLIRYVDDDFEGRQEWVPPGRLKVPWSRLGAFVDREGRWAALIETIPTDQCPEYHAAIHVFEELVDPALARIGSNRTAGVGWIHDIEGLARLLHMDWRKLAEDPASFVESDSVIVPWAVTSQIARRAARRRPQIVLQLADRLESEYSRRMLTGLTLPSTPARPAVHIEAEHYVRGLERPENRPCWHRLRSWCGAEAVAHHEELIALRSELARVTGLAQDAVSALRTAGRSREAARIERLIESSM